MNIQVQVQKEEQYKPEYSTNSDRNLGPYYDLKDIHIHQWSRGNIVPQFSHSKKYSVENKQNNVLFCIICHEIKLEIGILNGTKITSIYKIDKINSSNEINSTVNNDFEKSMNIIDNYTSNTLPIKNKRINYTPSIIENILNSKLFITNDYKDIDEEKIIFKIIQ